MGSVFLAVPLTLIASFVDNGDERQLSKDTQHTVLPVRLSLVVVSPSGLFFFLFEFFSFWCLPAFFFGGASFILLFYFVFFFSKPSKGLSPLSFCSTCSYPGYTWGGIGGFPCHVLWSRLANGSSSCQSQTSTVVAVLGWFYGVSGGTLGQRGRSTRLRVPPGGRRLEMSNNRSCGQLADDGILPNELTCWPRVENV